MAHNPKRTLAALLAAVLLALFGCGQKALPQAPASSSGTASQAASSQLTEIPPGPETEAEWVMSLLQGAAPRREVDAGFLEWCEERSPGFLAALATLLKAAPYHDDLFFVAGGTSLLALYDLYTGAAETEENIHVIGRQTPGAVVAITGDINLADDWESMAVLRQQPRGIRDCISPHLMRRLKSADVLLVNNEFSISARGQAMSGKQYTFRAAPANADILLEMGVDLAGLANNHVYDYGEDAFYDTLDTLADAGIPTVGAGRGLAEAMAPQYFITGGLKVAFVAASRAEKHVLTPAAGADSPGVLWCYEPEDFLAAVAEASQNADIVIAYPHWGTENTTQLEAVQEELGRALIDAGADAVVGAHPHCLQGVDWYNGKAIVYSLGNFWFNTNTVDTALLEITLEGPGRISLKVQPCLQAGGVTTLLEESADRQRIFGLLTGISEGLAIAADGTLSPAG